MSDNGAAPALSKAQRKLERLRLRKQLAETRIQVARAERQAKLEELRTTHAWPREAPNPGWHALREALSSKRDLQAQLLEARRLGKEIPEGSFLWDYVGDYQDMIDQLRSPDGLLLSAISIAADKRYGAYWPFFRTWQQLAILRGASRIIYQTSQLATGAVEGLTSYVIGRGSVTRAVEKDGCPPGLRLAVQEVLDEYSDVNDWPGLEQELLQRDMVDGEWILREFPQDDGQTLVRTVDPTQLIQPADGTLEEWSFGIRNPVGEEHDVQRALEYAIAYDGDNSRPVKVDAGQMHHHKSNTPRDVKRGLPDFCYGTYDALKTATRLIENMGEGAAIQAALAQIRQWEGPVTADQASAFQAAEADYQTTNPWTGGQQNVRQVRPGEIVDIPKGMTYVPPPFSQGSPVYIQVEQALLRAVAVRWNAPEWLTSGDASNNNYASSLTAESPFIKRCVRRQGTYETCFTEARWRALANYCEAKRGVVAGGTLYDMAAIRRYIDLQVELPSPEVRDRAEEAQANSIRIQGGWKSRQTVAQEEGLDWENERANIEQYNEEMGAAGSPLSLPGDDGGQGGGGFDVGQLLGQGGGMEGLLEQWIREEGFTGTITDKRGHKLVYANGKRVKGRAARRASQQGQHAPPAAAPAAKAQQHLDAQVQEKLAEPVKEIARTPEGKAGLAKGAKVAEKVKGAIAGGVKAAISGIDAETRGGLSLLGGALASKSPRMFLQGVSSIVDTVFTNVHQEVFENALAQHNPSLPATHLVCKISATVLAKAESGVLAGAAWAWARMRGTSEGVEWMLEGEVQLTPADQALLDQLAQVAAEQMRATFAAAGIAPEAVEIDQEALRERLASMLGGKGE